MIAFAFSHARSMCPESHAALNSTSAKSRDHCSSGNCPRNFVRLSSRLITFVHYGSLLSQQAMLLSAKQSVTRLSGIQPHLADNSKTAGDNFDCFSRCLSPLSNRGTSTRITEY